MGGVADDQVSSAIGFTGDKGDVLNGVVRKEGRIDLMIAIRWQTDSLHLPNTSVLDDNGPPTAQSHSSLRDETGRL